MTKKSNSPDNWECQGDSTGHENRIITENYILDSTLLNISSDSSDAFTTSLPPTNFYFVPVKKSNSSKGYRQKLTKPKNLHIPG